MVLRVKKNSSFFPLNSIKEKAKADMQATSTRLTLQITATTKEFTIYLGRVVLVNAVT